MATKPKTKVELPSNNQNNVSETTNPSNQIDINGDYAPLVLKLPQNKHNLFSVDAAPKFSTNIDYPMFALGFQHFIHANKDKMSIVKDFEGKKKVYLVMNKFERYVDNYDSNIGNKTKEFFGTGDKGKPDILSRGFYKLWELLLMYDLIDNSKPNFVSAHLAEGPGSFIQATMFYRDIYTKKGLSKNDKFYAITLHSEEGNTHVPELEKTFVNFYQKESPQRFVQHKTYSKQVAGSYDDKTNGDLTDPKTIRLFGGAMNEKADLVTADGGFDWKNENIQEQEAFRLIYAQMLGAIKVQKKGGNFVCKFFETFTMISCKFIYILNALYDQVHITKPLMSRPSNSEKYIVCMGFKYDEKDKEYKNIISKLDQILEECHKNKKLELIDIFPEILIENEFKTALTVANTYVANRQLKSINDIVRFINAQNYHGDTYQLHRQMQIDASVYWNETYLPDPEKLDKAKKNISTLSKLKIDRMNVVIKELQEKLSYD
jgi:23S rRNA U2552 (ribose-2'-O)-methylase RlmE/FtsJ